MFLQVSVFGLHTIWSPCNISKDSEYCIIYKNLKQKELFVGGGIHFLFVGMGCGKEGGKSFGIFSIYNYFYVIALCKEKKKKEKFHLKQICLS